MPPDAQAVDVAEVIECGERLFEQPGVEVGVVDEIVEEHEQGRPVLVQAGTSGTGRDVASRLAELVFTAQTTFEQGKEFYGDVMARLPRFDERRIKSW